jgi:berberine-like enzyme
VDATAFSHRHTRFEYVAAVKWSDPDEDRLRMGAAGQAAAKLEPFAVGAYVNALSDEGASGVRRAYSEAKRARLTEVKDAYDPDNVFTSTTTSSPPGVVTGESGDPVVRQPRLPPPVRHHTVPRPS